MKFKATSRKYDIEDRSMPVSKVKITMPKVLPPRKPKYERLNFRCAGGMTKFAGYECGNVSKPTYKFVSGTPMTVVNFLKMLKGLAGTAKQKEGQWNDSVSIFGHIGTSMSTQDSTSEVRIDGIRVKRYEHSVEMYSNE
jgi:hypothetical protein